MNSPDEEIFAFRSALSRMERLEPFVIMYHGLIVERNGLDLAVPALAIVRENLPGAELRIYGDSTPEVVMDTARRAGV